MYMKVLEIADKTTNIKGCDPLCNLNEPFIIISVCIFYNYFIFNL